MTIANDPVATHTERADGLDPVTFEVLKNAFGTICDEMTEQILRTCYSLAIFARDCSCALSDPKGNTVMHGSGDIAAHVGTLQFTARAIVDYFGDDIHEGDVFAINDPYRGGTHFNDVRIIRPIFHQGELICFAQANGHWSDVGGAVPGSMNSQAADHMAEGLRIPPVRIWDRGVYRRDIVELLASNTRAPDDIVGDAQAQNEATLVAQREIHRLIGRYGVAAVKAALLSVQDYVETLFRQELANLPDGTWETEDYLDLDRPDLPEGLIPIKVKMTIDGERVHYDLSGSHPAVHSFNNAAFGGAYSALLTGTKYQFPELPLNGGFNRAITVDFGEPGSVVNAVWPTPVAGFATGPFDKIMSSAMELWAEILPERAMAACFPVDYLLSGGRDTRKDGDPMFIWYDWNVGGWGGLNGGDGHNGTVPVYGGKCGVQSMESQERAAPVITSGFELATDSGGPGKHRGGLGAVKGHWLRDAAGIVLSYCNDRERSISWGMWGGAPSCPGGLWLHHSQGPESDREYLGAIFSNRPVDAGDRMERMSSGGGGLGDPLDRDVSDVCEDVLDEYVSVERARKDYGVVFSAVDRESCTCTVDEQATARERERIRAERASWLQADPEDIARQYRDGTLDALDLVRHYGVIVRWGTGELLPKTTQQFRAMLHRRMTPHWR